MYGGLYAKRTVALHEEYPARVRRGGGIAKWSVGMNGMNGGAWRLDHRLRTPYTLTKGRAHLRRYVCSMVRYTCSAVQVPSELCPGAQTHHVRIDDRSIDHVDAPVFVHSIAKVPEYNLDVFWIRGDEYATFWYATSCASDRNLSLAIRRFRPNSSLTWY